MRRALGVTAVLLLLAVVSVQTVHAKGLHFPKPPADDYDLFLDDVELRPGVTSDIHLKVFVNDEHPRFGKTVFAIPGWVHSAQSWDRYAEALFTHPFKGLPTSQVVAINLPGQGLGSLPTKISFGELLLDDYVTAILAALDRLPAHGIRPREIIGFSQGGILVQMVQEHLLDSGSSLFEEYGIFRAVLLAPSGGAPIDEGCTCDPDPESGEGCFLVAFLQTDSQLGRYYDIPAEWIPSIFYLNSADEVQIGTLTLDDIDSYRAPGPLFAAMQMTGYSGYLYPGQPYFPIPAISPGIFGLQSGTLLHVVAFEDDLWTTPPVMEEIFDYLIGSPWWSRYTLVEAEDDVHDRVHCLPMSNPSVIIEAMSEHGWFVW